MAKAFECWNDSGYYQIDSEYPNLRLVKKGSVYCNTPIPNDTHASGYIGDIAVPGEASVIAFRCAGRPCASNALSNDGTTYYHRFTVGKQYSEVGPSMAWVDYWAFAITPAPVNAGLQVFNQAGQLVFTSKDQPAKVLGNQTLIPPRGSSTDLQVLSARMLATVQTASVFGMWYDQFGQGLEHWTGYFAQAMNANTVRVSVLDMVCWRGPYAGAAMDHGPNTYLYIDVYGQ